MSDLSTSTDIEKIEAIDIILDMLPQKKLLVDFSRQFLSTMSIRTLLNITHNKLPLLLNERFKFFNETINSGEFGFRISKPQDAPYWLKDRLILDIAYPDARHLVMTLDHLFRKYDLRLTRKLHPIISIQRNKSGKLTGINSSTDDGDLISYVYVAFEDIPEESIIDSLKKDLSYHLDSIQRAHQEQEQIIERLMNAKFMINDYPIHSDEPKQEWINLIDWMRNLNFSFFGFISYNYDGKKATIDHSKGLGIGAKDYLKKHPTLQNVLDSHVKSTLNSNDDLLFDAIQVKSPIQRFENLMRFSVRVKLKNNDYQILNFLGVLKRSSLLAKNVETPLIHLKMDYIFKTKHMIPGSFDYNEVIRLFTATPKFELFRTSKEILLELVENMLSITNPNNIQCFKTHFPNENKIMYLISLPPYLYSQQAVEEINNYLTSKVQHRDTELIQITEDERYRLHLYFHLDKIELNLPSPTNVEADISELLKPWKDKFRGHIFQLDEIPTQDGLLLINKYYHLIPSHYIARTHPKDAVIDLITVDRLSPQNPIDFRIIPFEYPPESELAGKASLITIYSYEKLDLIGILPILQNLGIHVIDQLTSRIADDHSTYGFIQSFRVMNQDMEEIDEDEFGDLLKDILLKVFRKEIENDPLNALTLSAQLDWRAINLLQTIRNYYLQLLPPFSRDKINNTLLNHPNISKLLYQYFESKFSINSLYGSKDNRKKRYLKPLKSDLYELLNSVKDISEDTIVRRLFNIVQSTLRTNFFVSSDNRPDDLNGLYDPKAISIKINSEKIDKMPAPRPYREIYVHGSGVEAIHIRFGAVARGGLRWSDREDDFRTEVLGLVKTQQTKNVVIVPVGSKGGFIVKNQPVDKQKLQQLTQYQYRTFIHSMMEITDNYDAKGNVIPNKYIICYDAPDPYLVVAADKGTSTFSDLANEISTARNFWLDDGFASGGSYGYDHKKVGITAKGAWECTKIHFKEIGTIIDKDVITVSGIGDMAGDVFGNGMLLSKKIQLVAAFNHMHIFLDPNPVPEKSYQERLRLFKLDRSTWEDYNPKLISKGGAVFDRNAKEITLSKEIQSLLNIKSSVLSGPELIKAILKMKVDLLWFGGIGTYIKATDETHVQVGDGANNLVRIDASECNAKVIGEGANLGVTQPARIELESKGVHVNTDAIDNSAGVNMSDYEVNLKILLKSMVDQGITTQAKQRQLLEAATDEVTDLVLKNNQNQHIQLSLDTIRCGRNLIPFAQLIQELVDTDKLDAQSWFIPSQSRLAEMDDNNEVIPRSTLSIIQAHVKMIVYETLQTSDLVKHDFFNQTYLSYFPESLLKVFGDYIDSHPLKYDIISMLITNQIINQTGSVFIYQLQQNTGQSIENIIKTYLIANHILNGDQFRHLLFQESVTEEDRYKALLLFEDILLFITKDLLQFSHKPSSDFSDINNYQEIAQTLKKKALEQNSPPVIQWTSMGFSKEVASDIALLPEFETLAELIFLHETESLNTDLSAQLLFQIEDVFGFNWMEQSIRSLAPESYWEIEQQNQLLDQLYTSKLSIIKLLCKSNTSKVLEKSHVRELLPSMDSPFQNALTQYFSNYSELKLNPAKCDLTTLSVCLNRLRVFNA